MKKLTFLCALLCASMMSFAVDWTQYEFIVDGAGGGKYSNKYKVSLPKEQVVNIQHPGFATEDGIYCTFPAGITSCSVSSDIQGAGIILHLSAFTAQETEVTVVYATGTETFYVYYADGVSTPVKDTYVISFTDVVEAGWFTTEGNDTIFADGDFTMKVTNAVANSKIDASNRKFAVTADAETDAYTHRFNMQSAKPVLTLNVPVAGKLYIATCTARSKEEDPERPLVVKQGETELYNKEVLETAKFENGAYPYVVVDVEAGEVVLTASVGALYFYGFILEPTATVEPEPTPEPVEGVELFDPALASINETYFAPNWSPETNSTATYADGVITVDLKSQFYGTWQAQVKLNHNVDFSADKQYVFSCKFHSTLAFGGVTVKMDDNAEVIFENASVSLPANEDYVYTSEAKNGVPGNNKILVFDFGYAAPCQITISDISIKEIGAAAPVEPVVHPEAAPVPTHKAENVKSLYSDNYTAAVALTELCQWWWNSPALEQVVLNDNNNTLFYTVNADNCSFGWVVEDFNVGDYTKLHLHIYPKNEGTIDIWPVIVPEDNYHKISTTLNAGEWNDVVLDYSDLDLTPSFKQIGFRGFDALGTFYIDNVYFFKEGDGNDNPSGLSNTAAQVEVKKVVENGNVIIIRNGVRYNAAGAVVK